MENWFNYALNGNTKGLIELLNEVDIDSRGDIDDKNKGWTALMMASRYSNTTSSLDTVKLLLERGADVNLKSIDGGWTALMMAAKYSNSNSSLDNVKLLLEYNADIDLKSSNGWTALILASRNSNILSSLDTVKLLLKYNADINLKGNDDWTALMEASRHSNIESSLETVKLLLDRGADVNLHSISRQTALMLATKYSNTGSSLDTIKILLEYKAAVNLKNNNGWTALMMASRYSNTSSSLDTVKLLLKYNPDVNLFNNDGFSALMLAAINSNTNSSLDTVKLLLEYGADPFDNIQCPTEECKNIIDEARWKQLYQRDKETAKRYSKNSEYYLPKDVWEIILLEKRRQQLCQNLSSNKNKGILKLFAIELGISITENTTKAQLCGYISGQLVYGKEDKYKNVVRNKLDKNAKNFLKLAKDLGIDTDRPLSEIFSDLARMY